MTRGFLRAGVRRLKRRERSIKLDKEGKESKCISGRDEIQLDKCTEEIYLLVVPVE